MRSYSSVSARMSSVARDVVHIPPRLSVSSTPIQRTMAAPPKASEGKKNPLREGSNRDGPFDTSSDDSPHVRILPRRRAAPDEALGPLGQLAGGPQRSEERRVGKEG